ncbi:HIT family protein [Gracilibacillus alcaliphilus]|uniref:HIT family protein n=1 Tax=Gracilibacillus alcaliphilus TaxID=1401441 RepID=UPI00195D795F|nr:HIT family protein [Gracilibacillus alcaliphilus]MBM7676687.1 diadenosine tetraphosphate (Ap4A) HIT family hydrolase [Gracilibacillus alcaliphilus]
MEDCLICHRMNMIKEGANKYFVAELETGYVVIGDHQYFEGYTLFLCKEHKHELHELDSDYRQRFLVEMSNVSEAVYRAFKPDKLNYELLGNGDSHLHWHIFPRRLTEPTPTHPVWWTPKEVMYSESVKPSSDELKELKSRLLEELNKIV